MQYNGSYNAWPQNSSTKANDGLGIKSFNTLECFEADTFGGGRHGGGCYSDGRTANQLNCSHGRAIEFLLEATKSPRSS